jgi:competence protein ComEC
MIALCARLVAPPLAQALLQALCGLGEVVSWLAACFARAPFACIPLSAELIPVSVVFIALAALVYVVWPPPRVRSAVAVLIATVLVFTAVFVVAPRCTPPQLIMLDVGQGDCFVVREGSHALMVDTGPSAGALMRALGRHGITHLDALVITHLDADHCGALQALQGVVQVDKVLFAADLPKTQPQHQALVAARRLVGAKGLVAVRLGDCIRLSRQLSFQVVGPPKAVTQGENADSVCLMLLYDTEADGIAEHEVLLTGDAESAELRQMIDAQVITQCEILKLGHHGSKTSVTSEQLSVLQVHTALISVGAYNRYGHPSTEALEALQASGVSVFRTDENGDVVLTFSATDLRARCGTMG